MKNSDKNKFVDGDMPGESVNTMLTTDDLPFEKTGGGPHHHVSELELEEATVLSNPDPDSMESRG